MADAKIGTSFQRAKGGQVREALDRLEGLVVEGLKHGFFDYSIACEIANGGKRQLVIRAGKSHPWEASLLPGARAIEYAAPGLSMSSKELGMLLAEHGCYLARGAPPGG